PPPVVKPKRIPWHEVVIATVLLAAGAGFFLFHRAGPKGAAVPEKSIAVLPLVNSTGDPANEYFSDGMSEEFISSLSRLQDLKVALLGNNGQTAPLTTAATPSNQNVEAYNALLQGNFYNNRSTAEDTRKAIGYYEEAIRLDPRYALAYAKLSINALNLATNYG